MPYLINHSIYLLNYPLFEGLRTSGLTLIIYNIILWRYELFQRFPILRKIALNAGADPGFGSIYANAHKNFETTQLFRNHAHFWVYSMVTTATEL